MATITGFTASRMQEIENSAIVTGSISGDNLILTRFDGGSVNAGNVRGQKGDKGDTGEVTTAALNSAIDAIQAPGVFPGSAIADGTIARSALVAQIITSAELGNSAVITDKLNNSAVTTTKLADGSVTNAKLGNDSVTSTKIADDAVRPEHVNFIFVQSSAPAGVAGGIWIDT